MKNKIIGLLICISLVLAFLFIRGMQEKEKVDAINREKLAVLNWLRSELSTEAILIESTDNPSILISSEGISDLQKISSSLQPFEGLGHIIARQEYKLSLLHYYQNGRLSLIVVKNQNDRAVYLEYSLSREYLPDPQVTYKFSSGELVKWAEKNNLTLW